MSAKDSRDSAPKRTVDGGTTRDTDVDKRSLPFRTNVSRRYPARCAGSPGGGSSDPSAHVGGVAATDKERAVIDADRVEHLRRWLATVGEVADLTGNEVGLGHLTRPWLDQLADKPTDVPQTADKAHAQPCLSGSSLIVPPTCTTVLLEVKTSQGFGKNLAKDLVSSYHSLLVGVKFARLSDGVLAKGR